MAKLRAAALATLTVLFALLIASNFTPGVKADTATILTLSITPSTVEHSSRYQTAAVSTLQMSLTASGTGLASKLVYFYYRAVGSSSWINFYSETTDSNGQITITSFSIENTVAKGGTGSYEFKAEYVPYGPDVGVYAASTTTVTVTVTPHVPIATTITISFTPSTFEHSSASQPAATEDLLVTLSAGGNPLPNKEVIIDWHPVGASYWNSFDEELTDASGQIAHSSINLEDCVHTAGTYEFRAFYNPIITAEDTDYIGSEATCTVTLSPHTLQSTVTTISFTPSTFEHSSASQPMATGTLQVTLSAGGNPLAGRPLQISYRVAGAASWTTLPDMTMDSSGQYIITSFPLEYYVHSSGTYEFKAVYIPSAGYDDTDYLGSEATCSVTLSPHTLESTVTTISMTPSTVEHSIVSQPMSTQTFKVTLFAGVNPLPGRAVHISWRSIGSSSWNSLPDMTMDSSGQYSVTSFPLEYYVHNSGTYEFKAVYIPSTGVDDTDYTGSEATCTVTLTEVASDQSIITINNHQGSSSHLSTSGVTVTTTDTSLPNGFQMQFTSVDYGTTVPSTTSSLSVSGNLYYDVQLLPESGTLGPDVMVTVQITDVSFVSTSTVSYWTGSAWQQIPCTFNAPNTIQFTIEASKLSGTEFAVHQDSLIVTPEYPLGAILAVGACFFAVGVFKYVKKPTLHFSFPFSH